MGRALELIDAHDASVERVWRELEVQAQPGYLLTWPWVSAWLASLPAGRAPLLAVVHDAGTPRAALFVARSKVRRRLVQSRSVLELNPAGMLVAPGASRSLEALLALLPQDWDELHVPAIDPALVPDLAALQAHYRVRLEREELATRVDLTRIHPGAAGEVERIDDLNVALGLAGDDPVVREVIALRFAHGEVQVLRSPAGTVLELVAHGRVLNYHASSDAAVEAAIAYNAARGRTSYERIGAGHGRERRVWLRIERPVVRVALARDERPWYAALLAT